MYKVLISHLQINTIHKSLLTAYKHACQARHDLHVNHSENDPLAQKEPLGLILQPLVTSGLPVYTSQFWSTLSLVIQQEHGIDMVHYHHDILATYLGKSMGKNQWNINHLWRLGAATCYQPWVGINAFWHFAPRGDSQIPIPMLSSLIPSLVPPRRVWWGGGQISWMLLFGRFEDVELVCLMNYFIFEPTTTVH